jgi:hypothetical protein
MDALKAEKILSVGWCKLLAGRRREQLWSLIVLKARLSQRTASLF